MKIASGKENSDGGFKTKVVGETRDGESVKDALLRVAASFLGKTIKEHRWNERWNGFGETGADGTPIERLPALFVGSRIFLIQIRWDKESRTYQTVT